MASQLKTDNTADAATNDDNAPTVLNDIVLGGSLAFVNSKHAILPSSLALLP